MRLLEEGRSRYSVGITCKINERTLARLWRRYKSKGELSLLEPERKPLYSAKKKKSIVDSIINKGLSLQEASVKHDIAYTTLRGWVQAYQSKGLVGLEDKRMTMSKPKQKPNKNEEQDELEALRRRNEYLEAENALLKKVKALVEEREARQRATGRKPSRD